MGIRIVLVGFYVGDKYFNKYSVGDAYPQIAAYKLEQRFLEALTFGGATVRSVASIAVSTYPNNKRLYLPAGQFFDDHGVKIKVSPLINLPVLKLATRLLGSMVQLMFLKRNDVDAVCVYAAHTPNLMAAYIYSKLFNVPFYVYIPDLPAFMDMAMGRSFIGRMFKKIDGAIINRLVGASSGLFVTTKFMITDTACWRNIPYFVLEGIYASSSSSAAADSYLATSAVGKKVILYAGGLNESYGVRALVEGFAKADIEHELWLCGRGDLEGYLSEISKRNPAIKFLGFLSPSEVARIQAKAALLVLTRNPAEKYTKYSFPSKLLEYMSSGVPVLTTRLDGIPNEYYNFLNLVNGFSADSIALALEAFNSADQELLLKKAACGKVWLSENKSSVAVGRKITEFMEKNK